MNSLCPKEPVSVYKARYSQQALAEEQKEPVTPQWFQYIPTAGARAFGMDTT